MTTKLYRLAKQTVTAVLAVCLAIATISHVSAAQTDTGSPANPTKAEAGKPASSKTAQIDRARRHRIGGGGENGAYDYNEDFPASKHQSWMERHRTALLIAAPILGVGIAVLIHAEQRKGCNYKTFDDGHSSGDQVNCPVYVETKTP